ncbi:MAG TPA: diguanylate cyclase [Clostridia bacterium]|nr:diguanylate cyclase [Clostridia bacterium]
MKRISSKRERAMLAFMLTALVAATLYSMFLYQHTAVEHIRKDTYAALGAETAQEKSAFLTALDWQYRSLETVAAGLSEESGETVEVTLERLRLLADETDYVRIYLAYPDGTSRAEGGATINIADRLYFAQSLAGMRGLEAVVSRIDNEPHFIISVPVLSGDAVAYVLYAAYSREAFAGMLRAVEKYKGRETLILSADGERILGGEDMFKGNLFTDLEGSMDEEDLADLRAVFERGGVGIATYTLYAHETYLAYAPLGVNGWMICTAAPAASVNEEIVQTVKSGYLLIVSILIISAAFVLLFAFVVRQNSKRLLEDQARLNESDARYRMAIENTDVAIWDYDPIRRAIAIDERSRKLVGLDSNTIENAPEALIASGFVHPDSADDLRELHAKLAAGEKAAEGVFLIRAKDDSGWRYEHMRYTNLFDEKGNAYLAIGMGEDVTAEYAEKRRLDELSLAAQSDSMTGLLNHDATFNHIKRFLRAEGATGMHALFMIDIDDFKSVNDTLGHQHGDTAIKQIAIVIRQTFRATDIVGRVGGDEFMVLMKNAPDMNFVERKARELLEAMRIPCDADGACSLVSASAGVALYRGDGRPFEQIYAEADGALYRAKSAGKDRFAIGARQ